MPSSFNYVVPNGKISFFFMNELYIPQFLYLGFLGDSDGKESPWMQETRLWSLSWDDALEKGIATHSSILTWRTGKFNGQRSLVAAVHGIAELDTTEQLTHMYIYHNFFIYLIKKFPHPSCHKYCCNKHGCAYIFSNKYYVCVSFFLRSMHRSWPAGSNTSSISISNNCIKYNKIFKNNFNLGRKRPVYCK